MASLNKEVIDPVALANAKNAINAVNAGSKPQKTPYQQNVSQPVDTNKWYAGDRPTEREILGHIANVATTDVAKGREMYNAFLKQQSNPSSAYYKPYNQATNRSVAALSSYGIDTSNMDDDWYNKYSGLNDYLIMNGTTNAPSKPGKKASVEQLAAYEFYQVGKANDLTRKAKSEWAALQEEVSFWATAADWNLSDDDIVKRVYNEKFASKYPTLSKMDESLLPGHDLLELNEGIGYSKDALYGVIWKARNKDSNADLNQAMAYSALGTGNVWQDNKEISQRLDINNREMYAPHTVGSTMYDACTYYGRPSFDMEWLEANRPDGTDATETKMWNSVLAAEDFTEKAEEELSEANEWLNGKLQSVSSPEDVEKVMKSFDSRLAEKWTSLKKLDDGLRKVDDLTMTTRAVNYSRNDVRRQLEKAAQENASRPDGYETMKAAGVDAGTEQERADAKTSEARVRGASYAYGDNATQAEKNQFQNMPSTVAKLVSDTLLEAGKNPKGLFERNQKSIASSYTSTGVPLSEQAHENQKARDQLKVVNDSLNEIDFKKKSIGLFWDSVFEKLEPSQINALGEDYKNKYDALSRHIGSDEWDGFLERYKDVLDDHEAASQDPGRSMLLDEAYRSLYSIVHEDDPEAAYMSDFDTIWNEGAAWWDVVREAENADTITPQDTERYNLLTEEKKKLEETIANTNGATMQYQSDKELMERRILLCDLMGVDTTEMRTAYAVTNSLEYFAEYEATQWEPYSLYDAMQRTMGDDATYSDIAQATDEYTKIFKESYENAVWMKEYIQENGIQVPQAYLDNLDRYIAKMERNLTDHYYFTRRGEENFDEMVAKGKEIEKKNAGRGLASLPSDTTGKNGGFFIAAANGLEHAPLSEFMTPDEKDIYYYLLAAGDDKESEDYAYANHGVLGDFDLGDSGEIAAEKYYEYLVDQTYGMLHVRNDQATEESAKEEVNRGFFSGVVANLKAIALAPFEALAGAAYTMERKLSGEEFNPYNESLSLGTYSNTVNATTMQSMKDALGEDSALYKIASGAYEIAYNRGRSMANSTFFSFMGHMFDGSKFASMMNELLGAAPMAADAMAMSIARAKERGAQDWQAYAVGVVSFLAEDLTEGITYGNIKEALEGTGEEAVTRGVKDLLKKWLTGSGLEEMAGETITDFIENLTDEQIMGNLSDHNALVMSYIEQLKLDPNNPADYAIAEEYARKDEFAGILHTALISYLSPGMDVFTSMAADKVRDFQNIRMMTKDLQKKGFNVTMSDVRKEYNQHKQEELQKQNAPAQQTEQTEQAEGAAPAENVEQGEAPAEQVAEGTAQAETAPVPQRQLSDEDNAFISDLGRLDAAANSDPSSQTAAVIAVFGAQSNTLPGDTATAAAAALPNIFGSTQEMVKGIQTVLLGASKLQISSEQVKQALQVAALSSSSQSAKVMNSEEFRTATPEEKARMLAESVDVDLGSQTVADEMGKSVLESRIAEMEKQLIADGAFKPIEDAQAELDKANENVTMAEEALEEKLDIVEAKGEAYAEAANEMLNDPSSENGHALDRATNEFESADAVRKEYEQHLSLIQRAQAAAQQKVQQVIDETIEAVRQQAEAAIQQQDQARAEEEQRMQEEAAQQESEAAKLAEMKAQVEAAAREFNNFSRLNAEEVVNNMLPNLSDQDKRYAIGMFMAKQREMSQSTDAVLARKSFVESFAKKFNLKPTFVDDNSFNARINPRTGELLVSNQARQSDIMYAVLIHEITHLAENTRFAEQSESYKELADMVLQMRYGEGVTYQGILDQMAAGDLSSQAAQDLLFKKKIYDKFYGESLSNEYVLQELVADGVGYAISGDQAAMDRLVAEKPHLARRILNAIKDFLQRVTGLDDPTMTQAQQVVDMLEKALKDAGQNDQQAETTPNAKPLVTDNNGNDLATELPGGTVALNADVKHSLNSFTPEEQKRVRDALIASKRFSQADVDHYLSDAMGIASMIAADKTRLDFKANSAQVFLKPNNDYYFTLDASTLCAKRLLYQGTFDYVQHELQDEVFTPEDLIDLVNIMNDMGYETPCGICYVESRRRWLDTYASEFIEKTPQDIDSFIEKHFKKSSDEDKAALRERLSGEMPSIDELTTSDGLEKLRNEDPWMHKAFVAAMNAKGSANPKVVQLRTEYRGDIGKLSEKDIQNVKDIGGLRIQSFSDFETPHLLDMVQAVMDMSAVGLTSQAYTKVPNFAWVFGDTGIKINLSEIGKGSGFTITNGLSFDELAAMPYEEAVKKINLLYDNVEGMNHDEAMKIRDRYSKNVGTILVGMNDQHIIAAMADGEVDFIIPFHKSGWSAEELRKMPTLNGYSDYTDSQNERVIVGERQNKVKTIKDLGQKALDNWIAKEGENHPGYEVVKQENGKFTVSYKNGYQTESFQKHKERTKEGLSNFEPVGKNGYWGFDKSGEWNARKYLKMCAEAGRVPKFSQFLVDNGDGTFSLPEGDDYRSTAIRLGYWKTLIDFKMYDNDGNGAAQTAVTPNINMAQAERVLGEYQLGRQMPDRPNGVKGRFIPMENNNSVPIAKPAGDEFIRRIKEKRAGIKPTGPNDSLEATPPTIAANGKESAFGNGEIAGVNANARSAFGASQAPAVLGNTESTAEEATAQQQNAMAIDAETGESVQWKSSLPAAENNEYRFSLPNDTNPNYSDADGEPATNDAVEKSDITVKYSLRTEEPPKKVIECYKAFYVKDGKLYPPMVSNVTDEENIDRSKGKKTSGTMRGLETPVGVWLDADVGGLAVDENGEPLRTKKTNRLQVKNAKSGGSATLAFRPGWHLGEWPDAHQFYKNDPVTGETKSVMPDDLVFAKCEIAADVDYQMEALELGVSEKGGFNRTQAGLPRVPKNGFYKYRTNANPEEAPWYISGSMRITEILDDEDCRKICAKYGVVPGERISHHDIKLEDFGLKKGPVTPTENLERFKKNQASYDNDALLDRALSDERYAGAYTRRQLNFDDPTLLHEFEIDKITPEQVEEYKKNYKFQDEGARYSLPAVKPSDAPYMVALDRGEMDEVQRIIDERAKEAGYIKAGYHGTLNGGFTIFDKSYSHIGGNSGAGFYFSSNAADSESNYSDVEGADNWFKANALADQILEEFRESDEEEFEYEGYEITEGMPYDEVVEIAKKILTKNPQTYHVYLDQGKPYIRDFNNSTNLIEDVIDGFDESQFNRDDFDNEDDYYDAISMARSDEIYQAISDAVYNGIADVESNYEIYDNVNYEDIIGKLAEIGFDYENLTWNDLVKVLEDQYINIGTDEMAESTDGSHEIARAIIEAFGFDSIEDREVSRKFNQLKNMGNAGDTVHYIMFHPEQIKLADPVTYDDQGNVIPPSERFKKENNDIRYSLPSDDVLEEQFENYLNGNVTPMQQEINAGYAAPLAGMNPAMPTTETGPQRQFGRGMLQNSDEVDQQTKDWVLAHNGRDVDTNAAQIDRAIKWIRGQKRAAGSDGFQEALDAVTSDNFDYRSADGQARMIAVMGMAVAKGNTEAQTMIADAFNRQGTDLGRMLQARKLFLLMTPEGRQASMDKLLQRYQDELNAAGKNIDLKFSEWIYMAAAAATQEGDMDKVREAAAEELARQIPPNWKDRLRALRMFAMLANPRTHFRNYIGNALFVPAVGLKNKLGAIGELKLKPGERTKTLALRLPAEIRDFTRQDAETMKDTLTGEAKYNEENPLQKAQKPFKGLLQAMIDFNSGRLEAEDWKFLRGHYRRALGSWMKANGYTVEQVQNNKQLLEEGRAYAVQEAQKATYRDFNQLAANLNQISRKGGLTGFIVDAALPFKKTPANILRRGLEYSPAGLMRSLTSDLYHLKQWNEFNDGKLKALPAKAISPTQFIDRLCSGLAGTAILTVGAILGRAGIVSCGLDDDDDKFEKEKGGQEYSFKFRIGGRDYTYTMDWAAPMSMPFFVGTAIQEMLADQDGFEIEDLINAFGNITEPVFNLSMLEGVNSLFTTSQYDDTNTITQIGAKIASNYVSSYVPSILGATARTFTDDTRRRSFVESGKGTGIAGTFRYAVEQFENKTPGLSNTNIPYRDIWGNPEKSAFIERLAENFLSPGYINEYNNDPLINEMDRLYRLTGDTGMIPSDPGKTITLNKQRYALSAEQWDRYKEERGRAAFNMLNQLFSDPEYQNASADVQVQMVKGVWSRATDIGKKAALPDYKLKNIGADPVATIAHEETINGYKSEMIKALDAGDYEAYETMVEALRDAEIEEGEIKTKIGNTYRDLYKEAYISDDETRMSEIVELLENTGYFFDTDAWEEQADEKYGK